jgi:hypothetical protein
MPPTAQEKQPKVVQKLLLRTLLLVIVLGGIILMIQRTRQKDVNASQTANTAGWISAIEYKEEGTEAVAIKPDQTVTRAAGWHQGAQDRDQTWSPSGNFIFFISDRKEDTYHVYRWNPTAAEAEIRTVGKRGRSYPTFKLHPEAGDNTMLMTSGGVVMEFDPSQQLQTQVLPPTTNEITVGGEGDESGTQSSFAALYGQLGKSFRYARWCGNDDHIAAIMRRDEDELLIIQNMKPKDDGNFEEPQLITAGERIDLDVNPANGDVVYSVQNFNFPGQVPPEFIQKGKVVKPFRHYIGLWTAAGGMQPPIVASADDTNAFTAPAISPKGDVFLTVVGSYKDANVQRAALLSFPAKSGGAKEAKPLVRGEIYEPSWHPAGSNIVFARKDGDARTIYTVAADGSSERSITSGGRFGFPKFSPQSK